MDGRRSDAERWINLAYKLLINRDLVGTKSFAIRAKEADPTMGYADEILAVVDTLMAVQVQNMNGRCDWYGILGVERLCRDLEVIGSEYRRLVMLLNPQRNGLPFAEEAFGLVNEAWNVLGDPLRKSLYDSELSWLDSGSVVHQVHQQHQFLPMHQQVQVQPQVVTPLRVQPQKLRQQQEYHQHLTMVQQQAPYQPQFQVRPRQQLQFELSQPRVQAQPVVQPQQRIQVQQVSQPQPLWAQPQPVSQPQAQRVAQPSVHSQPVTQPQVLHQGYSCPQQPQPQPPIVQGHSRPEQQQQHQQRQQEPIRMQGEPHPQMWKSPVKNLEEEVVVAEVETDPVDEDESEVSTFWTACPFCYHLFEYLKEYEDCTLRCQNKNCRRAFHGSPIAPPPESKSDKKASFCSWGFFPVGASLVYLNSGKSESGKHSWLPFSPMFTCPTEPSKGVAPVSPNSWNRARPKPKATILDDDDYVMMELSESSDSSDTDFVSSKSTGRKKRGRPPKAKAKAKSPVRKSARLSVVEKSKSGASEARDNVVGNNGNTHDDFANVGAGDVSVAKVASTKSALNGNGSLLKKASGKNPKDLGKLDLNVEFNNEVDETISTKTNTKGAETSTGPGTSAGTGTTSGVEENIETEGIGFFEGLDEFLNSLPILSAVGDDKVKAA